MYAGLGIGEVWIFEAGAFRVLALEGGTYAPIAASRVLPEVDLALVARYAVEADQHAALRAFRERLREG